MYKAKISNGYSFLFTPIIYGIKMRNFMFKYEIAKK